IQNGNRYLQEQELLQNGFNADNKRLFLQQNDPTAQPTAAASKSGEQSEGFRFDLELKSQPEADKKKSQINKEMSKQLPEQAEADRAVDSLTRSRRLQPNFVEEPTTEGRKSGRSQLLNRNQLFDES
ncbi:MAG: hypothetical protein KDA85_20425, partial [Planctomycetaceae bacterium]|nr:hypothetical protein [Planctomycetaceae bacterium]